jgi:hypothetical protein
MTTDDDETKVVVHYGDKIITVGERFDQLDGKLMLITKALLVLGIGELLLVGVHLPEVGPILAAIAHLL